MCVPGSYFSNVVSMTPRMGQNYAVVDPLFLESARRCELGFPRAPMRLHSAREPPELTSELRVRTARAHSQAV